MKSIQKLQASHNTSLSVTMYSDSDSESDDELLDEEELDKKRRYEPSEGSALKSHLEAIKNKYIESENEVLFPQ